MLPAAAAGGGRVHRDPGGGREEGRGRAGRGSCGGQPCGAEAEQMGSTDCDLAGRHVGRCRCRSASGARAASPGCQAAGRVAASLWSLSHSGPRSPSALSAVALLSYALHLHYAINRSALPPPRTRGCTYAQRVLHGVYTLGALLLTALRLHVKPAAQAVFAWRPTRATVPGQELVTPPRAPKSVAGGEAPPFGPRRQTARSSLERKSFTTPGK